jgi:hypothetical protein
MVLHWLDQFFENNPVLVAAWIGVHPDALDPATGQD